MKSNWCAVSWSMRVAPMAGGGVRPPMNSSGAKTPMSTTGRLPRHQGSLRSTSAYTPPMRS